MVRSTLSCYLVALLVALLLRLTKEESPSVKRISTATLSAYSVYIAIFVGVVVCPEIGYEAHP